MRNLVKLFEEYIASDAVGYEVGDYVYHVTPAVNVGGIMKTGLVPKDGVSINGKPYENRLYFATSLIAAYDISMNFQSHGRGDRYDILKIDSSCIGEYEEDPLFVHGIYVDYPVDAKYVVDVIRASDLFGKYDDDDLDRLYERAMLFEVFVKKRFTKADRIGSGIQADVRSTGRGTVIKQAHGDETHGIVTEKGREHFNWKTDMMIAFPELFPKVLRHGEGSDDEDGEYGKAPWREEEELDIRKSVQDFNDIEAAAADALELEFSFSDWLMGFSKWKVDDGELTEILRHKGLHYALMTYTSLVRRALSALYGPEYDGDEVDCNVGNFGYDKHGVLKLVDF